MIVGSFWLRFCGINGILGIVSGPETHDPTEAAIPAESAIPAKHLIRSKQN